MLDVFIVSLRGWSSLNRFFQPLEFIVKPNVFVLCEHFSYEMIDTLIYCVRTARRYDDEEMFSRMKEALEMVVSPTLCDMHVVYR